MTFTYTEATATHQITGDWLAPAEAFQGACEVEVGYRSPPASIYSLDELDFFRRLVDQDRFATASRLVCFILRPHLATSPQVEKNARAIALLQSWLDEDSDYDRTVWPQVKRAIEENRLSDRNLFDG